MIRRNILGTADILATSINDVIGLVENKEIARNAIPSVSVMSEFKRVKNSAPDKDHQTSPRKQFTSAPSDHFIQLPLPGCKKLLRLYGEGLQGWNTRLYALRFDCFSKGRRKQREASPPPSSTPMHATCEPKASTAQPEMVTQSASPKKKSNANTCPKIHPRCDAHHVFENVRWTKFGMSDHHVVYVSVSADEAYCRTNDTPNVPEMSPT